MLSSTDILNQPREHWHSPEGKFIREVIFGINDGMIETLGFVTGVFGATATGNIIVITGLAQVIAGSISMSIGAYVSQKSFKEFYDREEEIEKKEIEVKPGEERAEIEAIYKKKGFEGDELKMVVDHITSDKKVWLDTMMAQELGLIREGYTHPVKSGAVTGLSYVLGAVPPLAPYFFLPVEKAFIVSILLSMTFLFFVGAMKSRWARIWWAWSAIEVVGFGLGAVAITYSIGRLIATIFAVDIAT